MVVYVAKVEGRRDGCFESVATFRNHDREYDDFAPNGA
jgi:hypothetical protein